MPEKKKRLHNIPLKSRQVFQWRPHAYVLLVKLRKGKRVEDFVEFFERVDRVLVRRYGKTRHRMGIHERVTYVTRGKYHLAVLYDAPNAKLERRFRAVWLKKGGAMRMSDGIGTGTVLAVVAMRPYN
jgi:uncharacterized protein with GYD domain